MAKPKSSEEDKSAQAAHAQKLRDERDLMRNTGLSRRDLRKASNFLGDVMQEFVSRVPRVNDGGKEVPKHEPVKETIAEFTPQPLTLVPKQVGGGATNLPGEIFFNDVDNNGAAQNVYLLGRIA
jgi:hypothetical protein